MIDLVSKEPYLKDKELIEIECEYCGNKFHWMHKHLVQCTHCWNLYDPGLEWDDSDNDYQV